MADGKQAQKLKLVYLMQMLERETDPECGLTMSQIIDRMELLQVSDAVATRNDVIANYAHDDFVYQSFGMFHGNPALVTLRVKPPLVDVIVDRFGRDVEVVQSAVDYVDVRVKVRKSPQFFGWVAGLDGGVTICAPKQVAVEYADWLKSLLD